jgi:Na+/H+-dicarboxylate symporter
MRIPMSLTRQVVLAMLLSLAIGTAISASGSSTLEAAAAFIQPIGTLWVNAIRMSVVPLVVSLLIVGVASVEETKDIGRLGLRTYSVFIALLLVIAVYAALVAPALFAWMPADTGNSLALGNTASSTVTEGMRKLPTLGEWLVSIVPTNPIRAAADGDMLPLVIFSILFALACLKTASEVRQPVLGFFKGVSAAMLVLVRWIIALAPIGVFALMLPLASRIGATAAGALGYFVLINCAMLVVVLVLLYPLAVFAGGISLRSFARAVLPAQAVAMSSRSSLASLPALIDGARKLELPPTIKGFVLPLAVSTFKSGGPVSGVAGAVFLSHLYGVPIGPADIALVAIVSTVLTFATPGIPSGSLILMTPLYTSIGLPAEGIGLLIAVDLLPDIFKTVTNVTADMVAATIVSRRSILPFLEQPGVSGV